MGNFCFHETWIIAELLPNFALFGEEIVPGTNLKRVWSANRVGGIALGRGRLASDDDDWVETVMARLEIIIKWLFCK